VYGLISKSGVLFKLSDQGERRMNNDNTDILEFPADGPKDILTGILREKAQEMLAMAIKEEADEWIRTRRDLVGEDGRQLVVRNGHLPERPIMTGIGAIEVKKPRIRDRRPEGEREIFESKILPPYLRKAKSVEELIPWLYLRGVSTGDFTDALQAILGEGAPGLSASTVTRLKAAWEEEYKEWTRRSLRGKRYIYIWVDGIHFNIRLEEDRQCILVVMGATREGRKELVAVADGYRESEQSWMSLLLDIKNRGVEIDPLLATGDGALGFWKALPQVFPSTEEQRCWVHKTANVLDKLPKRLQPEAKGMLHEIWMAPCRADAERAFDLFVQSFQAKYPKATDCLSKDRTKLLQFYDFPAEHWQHIRTTNPIESTFATVRLRTRKTKGSGSRMACLAMVFKLLESAALRWRALNACHLISDLIEGVIFTDGVKQPRVAA
jgi:putative transposase